MSVGWGAMEESDLSSPPDCKFLEGKDCLPNLRGPHGTWHIAVVSEYLWDEGMGEGMNDCVDASVRQV